jgi:short-subunit dehydrogenase
MVVRANKKTVLITGASEGIGRAFAELIASEDNDLIIVARNDDALNRIAGVEMTKHATKIVPIAIDLVREGGVKKLLADLKERDILPDIVINNAGMGFVGEAKDLSIEDQLTTIDLNIKALSELTLAMVPEMVKRGSGGFINISSTAAFMPGPYMAVYYASKAYVQSFSTALGEELKGTGVRVMTVCPGPVDTGFQGKAEMDTKRLMYKLMGPFTAANVAEAGWYGYKAGNKIVIPGIMNFFTVLSAKFMPKWVMMQIVKLFQKPKNR